jgi:Xaa-Pro dipeptidase
MRELELDVLLVHSPENFYYLTGLRSLGYSIYQALLIRPDGELDFVTREWEASSSVPGTSNIGNPIGYADASDPIEAITKAIGTRGLGQTSVGIELSSRNLTPNQFRALQEHNRAVTFVDVSGLVESLRQIKSEAEMFYMRASAQTVRHAIKAFHGAVREETSEREIAAVVYQALIRAGSECPGYPPFICSGPRTALAHATWDDRIAKRGDPVLAELSGSVMRYHSPMSVTEVIGSAEDKDLTSMRVAIDASLRAAIALIKPGARSGDVHNALWTTIAQAGFDAHFDRNAGYAVGIAYPPTWSEARTVPVTSEGSPSNRAGIDGKRFYIGMNNPTILRPGMVFHVIPTIMQPGVRAWYASATIAVTDSGSEVLTGPDDLCSSPLVETSTKR